MVWILDLSIGNLLRHFYFMQSAGEGYRTTYSMDSTNADILVFGSSRATHHYVTNILEDNLRLSTYNTGRDGNFLFYNYAVFKAILNRYSPKVVIFDINIEEMYYKEEYYDRLSSLLPYYKEHSEIRNIINLKSHYEKFKLLSSIYPFNSNLISIIRGNSKLHKQQNVSAKGYVPLYKTIKDTVLINKIPFIGSLDSNKINVVKEIIFLCKRNNIKLVFIQSPLYANTQKGSAEGLIEKFALMNHIQFWNYLNDPLFLKSPSYFQDINHLNESGANYFTAIIATRISNTLLADQDN